MSKERRRHAKAGDMNALSPLDQSFNGAHRQTAKKMKK